MSGLIAWCIGKHTSEGLRIKRYKEILGVREQLQILIVVMATHVFVEAQVG